MRGCPPEREEADINHNLGCEGLEIRKEKLHKTHLTGQPLRGGTKRIRRPEGSYSGLGREKKGKHVRQISESSKKT